jgi:6-pyruvoyl-tetrahydropterin synthase
MEKSFIWVTFQREGIHKYPAALTDPTLATGDWLDVSYLGYNHRHTFHFRVELEVEHDDRAIEFIQAKRQMERLFDQGTLQLDHKSCEMIARELHQQLVVLYGKKRDMVVEVSEDNENGCRMVFEATDKEVNCCGAMR